MKWLVVATACLCVAFAAWTSLHSGAGTSLCKVIEADKRIPTSPEYPRAGLSVQEVSLNNFLHGIEQQVPVVARGADKEGLQAWGAFDAWAMRTGPQPDSRRIPAFLPPLLDNVACQEATIPYFTYFQSYRPMSTLRSVTALQDDAPKIVDGVRACSFIAAMHGQTVVDEPSEVDRCSAVYYSTRMEALGEDALLDVLPLDELIVYESAMEEFFPQESGVPKLMLWLGSNGTVTRMHYDWSHNMHVVVEGRKHFRLYPPHDAGELQLYPYLHPRATKAQAAFSNVGFDNPSLHPYDVTVETGDVLYIPPLWLHEVTALAPTVSLAVWSQSAETLLMNDVLDLGLPFTSSMMASPQSRADALAVFLHMLVLGVERFGRPCTPLSYGSDEVALHEQSCADFMASLYASRYKPLEEAAPEAFSSKASFRCTTEAWITSAEESYDLEQHFLEHVRDVFVPRFAFLPKERRDVWLADFVEVSANFILGLSSVAPFLQCMSQGGVVS